MFSLAALRSGPFLLILCRQFLPTSSCLSLMYPINSHNPLFYCLKQPNSCIPILLLPKSSMASIIAALATPIVVSAALHRKLPHGISTAFVVGLSQIRVQGGRVRCASTKKSRVSGPLLAAVASMIGVSRPALALVDERLSTEGTGLSLGLSNNLLGWILLGVFGLIWALYFVYTSTLEEDEESGLSL